MITRENYEIYFLDFVEGKLNLLQKKELQTFLKENPDLKNELDEFENISLEKPFETHDEKQELKKNHSWLVNDENIESVLSAYSEGKLNQEQTREMDEFFMQEEKNFVLQPELSVFNEKEFLKKNNEVSITAENYSFYFIAYHEHPQDHLLQKINSFISKNENLKREFVDYGKVKLKSDETILFTHKNKLKKKERDGAVVIQFVRYSLAAAAAVTLIFLLNGGEEQGYNPRTGSLASQYDSVNEIKTPEKQPQQNNLAKKQDIIPVKKNNEVNIFFKEEKLPNKKEPVVTPEEKPLLVNDSVKTLPNIANQQIKNNDTSEIVSQKDEVAHNSTKQENYVKPLDFLGSKVNKKYFNSEEVKEEESGSGFLAMQNIVKKVSGGNAEIAKKETAETKEVSFSIGNFQFQRKKSKN